MPVLPHENEANVVIFDPVAATRTCITTLLLMLSGNALGESVDKSGFHLFNPTPKDAMRDFATDRPDKTESPYSVDAGHFQIEMDLVTFERDRDRNNGNDIVTESWAVAPINFKVGLCNRVDFQVIVETYNRATTVDRLANSRMRQSGYGDTTARLKVNAWGNDEGTTALALMPYVKFPSNQNNLGNSAYEGGLIIPASIDIGHGFGLGLMT